MNLDILKYYFIHYQIILKCPFEYFIFKVYFYVIIKAEFFYRSTIRLNSLMEAFSIIQRNLFLFITLE